MDRHFGCLEVNKIYSVQSNLIAEKSEYISTYLSSVFVEKMYMTRSNK